MPATDPFSTFGHGRPWVAYSWLFEILVFGVFSTFGLVGIWLFPCVMTYAVAVAVHVLIVRREPRYVRTFRPAGGRIPGTLGDRLGTSLAVLDPLQHLDSRGDRSASRGRRPWWLWLLPPIFSLWANIHIQFVYGLGLAGTRDHLPH